MSPSFSLSGVSEKPGAVHYVEAVLAVWFGLQVLFAETRVVPLAGGQWTLPVFSSVPWIPAMLFVGAAFSLLRLQLPMLRVLAVSAAVGVLASVLA